MEPEAKYTLVGVTVLILVALVATAVVWLKSSGEGVGARPYKIYFERQSLEGLEPRSYVTMRGIRVGSVTDFRFSSRRPGVVEVFITVDPTTPVRESTRATVGRHLVTGLASVQLANTTEESPPLAQVPPGEPYPVIAEGDSSMRRVSENLTQLAARADETLQRLNDTLSPENRAALAEALNNLRKLTARYDALGTEAERLTRRADKLLASSDEELRTTAQALRSAADSVGAAADRLRDPRQAIFGPSESSRGPGEEAR